MRNQMLPLIFLVLLFTDFANGQLWGILRQETDEISIANPQLEMLITLPMKANEYVNNGTNFTYTIEDQKFDCISEDGICKNNGVIYQIKEIEEFGYVSKGDENLKKNLFVPYPEHIQSQIRKGDVFTYTANTSYWNWKYEMNPIEMKQKNISVSPYTVRQFHAISSKTREYSTKLKLKVTMNEYETYFTPIELERKKQELAREEVKILNNYCQYRSHDWCRQELETVKGLKRIYGDNIRIVNGRNTNLAPEFNFFNTFQNSKQELKLHLNNLADVSDNPYTYEQFTRLDTYAKSKIEDKLKEKIANVHGCHKDEIIITTYTKGSVNVNYETPATTKSIDYAQLDTAMQNKFNQFESMEVHSAFFRPEFDINMFDEAGHKDFSSGGSSFDNIGGLTYHQPSGWIRMGLNVKNKYGNLSPWLEPFGEGNPGLWARGYHGPGSSGGDSLDVTSKIAKTQLRIGSNNAYGAGVYWSDDPNFAKGSYDGKTNCFGKTLSVKLQVAVRPGGYSNNGNGNFHCPNPQDIRVYGILIR